VYADEVAAWTDAGADVLWLLTDEQSLSPGGPRR
jgi:hypothetical protein